MLIFRRGDCPPEFGEWPPLRLLYGPVERYPKEQVLRVEKIISRITISPVVGVEVN